MKNAKNIYWTSTILFAGFMAFTAVPDIILMEDAKQFITQLGYPLYFIPFIGAAKLLGSIAILMPDFKKIKEWAYAGLVFDLIGAAYSNLAVHGFDPGILFIGVLLSMAAVSYLYNQKVNEA
jgi:hypothetical protein